MEAIDRLEVNQSSSDSPQAKKWALYPSSSFGFQLLMVLTAIIGSCTLSMNIFLIRVFHVTNGGMKSVKFSPESGMWFKDDVVFVEMLKTGRLSHISHNRASDGFLISSGRDLHIESNARTGKANSLTLSDGNFDVRGSLFTVYSTFGEENVMFQAGIDEVLISVSDIPIMSAGFTLRGSLTSSIIRGNPNHDFRVESPMGKIAFESGDDSLIVSRSEYMTVNSGSSIQMHSRNGAIRLGSHKLEMKNLPVAQLNSVRAKRRAHFIKENRSPEATSGSETIESFALCSCRNGRIFYDSEENCSASSNYCKDEHE